MKKVLKKWSKKEGKRHPLLGVVSVWKFYDFLIRNSAKARKVQNRRVKLLRGSMSSPWERVGPLGTPPRGIIIQYDFIWRLNTGVSLHNVINIYFVGFPFNLPVEGTSGAGKYGTIYES